MNHMNLLSLQSNAFPLHSFQPTESNVIVSRQMQNSTPPRHYLPEWYKPSENDVLCGRGPECYHYIGNERFRELVDRFLPFYKVAETKTKKSKIIWTLVNRIRKLSPDGGFIKKDRTTGVYYEVGDFLAREKTSQAFRDAISHESRQSGKAAQLICKTRKESTTSAGRRISGGSSYVQSHSTTPLHCSPELNNWHNNPQTSLAQFEDGITNSLAFKTQLNRSEWTDSPFEHETVFPIPLLFSTSSQWSCFQQKRDCVPVVTPSEVVLQLEEWKHDLDSLTANYLDLWNRPCHDRQNSPEAYGTSFATHSLLQ